MAAPIRLKIRPQCARADCERPHFAHGYCRPHCDRFVKGATAEEMAAPIAERNRTGVLTCGHPDRKYYANGMCHSCYVTALRKSRPDDAPGNSWSERNPERARYLKRRNTLRKHGITPEDYETLWEQQGGKCANPRCDAWFPLDAPDYRLALHVDHCHVTSRIRALLCPGCNVALGQVGESAERLAGLIEYIDQFAT